MGKRQGDHRGPFDSHQRVKPTRLPTDSGRQLGNGGRVEHSTHRKAGIQRFVDRGDQTHCGKRIPTQVKERVVDPNPLEPEDMGVYAGQDFLDRAGRGAVVIGLAVVGRGEGAGVEFAVDR